MIEGSSEIAGLKVSIIGGELMIYEPGGEGYSEIITAETLERLRFIEQLAKYNCPEDPTGDVLVAVEDELVEPRLH